MACGNPLSAGAKSKLNYFRASQLPAFCPGNYYSIINFGIRDAQ
jgi:hypothetical protein